MKFFEALIVNISILMIKPSLEFLILKKQNLICKLIKQYLILSLCAFSVNVSTLLICGLKSFMETMLIRIVLSWV